MKKFVSVLLALAMVFSLSVCAFAADTSKTEKVLAEISKSGKFKANITSFSSDEWKFTNQLDLDFYDDLTNNKIRCNINNSFMDVIYSDSKINLVMPKFFSYFPISSTDIPLITTLTGAVDTFQSLFKVFVDDPTLDAFTLTSSTVERNGKTCTCEKYKGKVIGTSGSFYYDENGDLCEIVLSDNADVSIGLTLEDYSASFEDTVFDIPLYYLNLTIVAKILIFIIGLMSV